MEQNQNPQPPGFNPQPQYNQPQYNQPQYYPYPQPEPMMPFWTAVKTCFKKYFDFTGRARRSEYWWFVLFTCVVSMVCSFIDGMLKVAIDIEFVNIVVCALLFIPGMTVGFRRLHDIGRSGWWSGLSYILLAISIL